MSKTRTGIMLAAAAVAGACSGGVGDAMVDAGRMLTDAGTTVRDAMGGGDAQAMDSGGQGTDGSSPGDSGGSDGEAGAEDSGGSDGEAAGGSGGNDGEAGSEDSGTPASQVYLGACDHEATRRQVLQSNPDQAITSVRRWARIELPSFDPENPPQVAAWLCDLETTGAYPDPAALGVCSSGWDCTDTGQSPGSGCSQTLVQRMEGNTAWVQCGSRSRQTDSEGVEIYNQGYRWNTVRLVVD